MIWLLCHAICDVFPQYLEIKKWWSKILASGTSVSKTSQVLLCLFFCEIFMAYFWDTFFKLDFPLVSLGSWQTGNLFVTLFVDIFLTFLSHFLRHFFFYVWFSRLCLSNCDRPRVSMWHFLGHIGTLFGIIGSNNQTTPMKVKKKAPWSSFRSVHILFLKKNIFKVVPPSFPLLSDWGQS